MVNIFQKQWLYILIWVNIVKELEDTDCGEVAVAVNNAKYYINLKAKVSLGYSTDKHEPVMKKAHLKKREIEKE